MSDLDPRIGETVEHVQRAALELIRAMRIALDVAEDFVGDPAAVQTLIQGAVIAARSATETVVQTAAAATAATAAKAPSSTTAAPSSAGERVERIRVE